MDIRSNVEKVREKIARAASRTNRTLEDIYIVAATKGRTPQEIREVVEAGIKIIGENRWQEARKKIPLLRDKLIEWHFIGHLQTNKVKQVMENFKLIQSVDSQNLIEEISKRAIQENRSMDILVEVNISGESSKYGLPPEKVLEFIEKNARLPGIKIKGIMTIAPWLEREKVRPFFIKMKRLFDRIEEEKIKGVELTYLSMGMSDDFTVAIEEGSNMVRIGRAIFGERQSK